MVTYKITDPLFFLSYAQKNGDGGIVEYNKEIHFSDSFVLDPYGNNSSVLLSLATADNNTPGLVKTATELDVAQGTSTTLCVTPASLAGFAGGGGGGGGVTVSNAAGGTGTVIIDPGSTTSTAVYLRNIKNGTYTSSSVSGTDIVLDVDPTKFTSIGGVGGLSLVPSAGNNLTGTVSGGGSISFNGGGIGIGTSAGSNTVSIGTGNLNAVTIGNANGGVTLQAGTININNNTGGVSVTNIGTGTTTGDVNIGNYTGNNSLFGSTIFINDNSGGNTPVYIGTGTSAGDINIGNLNARSVITSNIVNINNNTGAANFVNINSGTSTGNSVVGNFTGSLQLRGGNINMNTSGSGTTNINTGVNTGTLTMGNTGIVVNVAGNNVNINNNTNSVRPVFINTGSSTGNTNIGNNTGSIFMIAGNMFTNIAAGGNYIISGAGTIDVSTTRIINVAAPTGANDAVTKSYLESVAGSVPITSNGSTISTNKPVIPISAFSNFTGIILDNTGAFDGKTVKILITGGSSGSLTFDTDSTSHVYGGTGKVIQLSTGFPSVITCVYYNSLWYLST